MPINVITEEKWRVSCSEGCWELRSSDRDRWPLGLPLLVLLQNEFEAHICGNLVNEMHKTETLAWFHDFVPLPYESICVSITPRIFQNLNIAIK